MKKFLYILIAIFTCFACSQQNDILDPEKIYFFYSDSCSHCHDALAFIDKEYPNLELTMVNVSSPKGQNMLFSCARKFKLGPQIGTPLFCTKDNYLMGWSEEYIPKFRELVASHN